MVVLAGAALLVLGAVALLWGAEEFMEHVADLARGVGLPAVALGLLLAGAEPEELTTALVATAQGAPTLAATDALGANVTMTTLGLGLATVVASVAVDATLRRYAVLAVIAGGLGLAAVWDGRVSRVEGVLLVAAYGAVVAGVWLLQRTPPRFGELAEQAEPASEGSGRWHPQAAAGGRASAGIARLGLRVLLGLLAMTTGGALAVRGAEILADSGGLGQEATGLTALAFATSVEVLALVGAARRRGLTTVALGGVLGSVIYNATLTLGAAALVTPLALPDLRWVAALAAVLPAAVLLTLGGRRPRAVGAVLVIAYPVYVVTAVLGPAAR